MKNLYKQGYILTLLKNKLIFNKQFGFRSNYSTNHALVSIIEHIRSLVDTGHYVCGVFVDDTFIMYSSLKAKTIETVINTELKRVSTWLRLNNLSLNADKTEQIFFHSKQHALSYGSISIIFNYTKLTRVENVK